MNYQEIEQKLSEIHFLKIHERFMEICVKNEKSLNLYHDLKQVASIFAA